MPPIYSSLYQSFIRQGFAKSVTHGYAQSVVAATHSHVLNSQNRPSFARRHSARVGRLQSLGLQSAFHTSASSAHAAALDQHRHDRAIPHAGLDAYFENLQRQQDAEASGEQPPEDDEWVQYQFPKRIEWNPEPSSVLAEDADAATAALAEEGRSSGAPPGAEAALAHIDAALEKEIQARQELETLEEEVASLRAQSPLPADLPTARSATPVERARTPLSIARSVSPPVDPQSQAYADHLAKLSDDARFAEIPAVFEAMLVAGIRPIAASYNALLLAAINLPSAKFEVVSKALDVYTDMRRRRVVPDSRTYNILVGLLAARSLEVLSAKKTLEDKRLRFGGMDEPGKFIFTSHELDYAMLSEDDRLDTAVKLFRDSVSADRAAYSSDTYHQLISACAQVGRVNDMLQLFEHMELSGVTPRAATFPAMITSFAAAGDLVSAVECYNEYRTLAVAHDKGESSILDRLDSQVYAAVVHAYVISDKPAGALKFYNKITREYGLQAASVNDAVVEGGFVNGLAKHGLYDEALQWAHGIKGSLRAQAMALLTVKAADGGDKQTAAAAFAALPEHSAYRAAPAISLLALNIRGGDVAGAAQYWQVLNSRDMQAPRAFIEPTAMLAVALIGSGQVMEGLSQSSNMFQKIRESSETAQVAEEIEEAEDFIATFMAARNIADPREMGSVASATQPATTLGTSEYASTPTVSSFEDNFDPHAQSTDFKGSSWIAEELEGSHGRKGSRLDDALARLQNMRRAGRHPRYITYAKLISAAARESKLDLCHEILAMARTDVPLLTQYAVVRYGWSSILDAMVGACLNLGHRNLAQQFHQELLDMGASPSANTFGLYITTLKESTKTFDEATEAVKVFHRAKAEGIEPTSFLYNALIGKLGKARRIDDCLFYFGEMRGLGIKPTSVTYGTIVNALCRVSDEKFAEELFDEMESMPNYKPRPAPYNSMMQFFLTTKRDKSKVLAYYNRMTAKGIAPTAHTFKLLVDTHATLEPIDMAAAESVLNQIRTSGQRLEPVHFASLIHARGCVLHDIEGARRVFDSVVKDPSIPSNASIFQALFESMVANHRVTDTEPILGMMRRKGVELTAYIANTLIHGWAAEKNIARARDIYTALGVEGREPSTYEAMTRANLAVQDKEGAQTVVDEMLTRGYPPAVFNKVLELVSGGAVSDGAA